MGIFTSKTGPKDNWIGLKLLDSSTDLVTSFSAKSFGTAERVSSDSSCFKVVCSHQDPAVNRNAESRKISKLLIMLPAR